MLWNGTPILLIGVFVKNSRHFGSNLNKMSQFNICTWIASSCNTWWKRIAQRKYYYFYNEITHCTVCTVWRRDVSKWKYFQAHLLKNKGGLSRIFTVTLSCNKQHCSWLSFISCICVMSFVFFFRCTIRPRQSFWSHIWIQPYIEIIMRSFLCFSKGYKKQLVN